MPIAYITGNDRDYGNISTSSQKQTVSVTISDNKIDRLTRETESVTNSLLQNQYRRLIVTIVTTGVI